MAVLSVDDGGGGAGVAVDTRMDLEQMLVVWQEFGMVISRLLPD